MRSPTEAQLLELWGWTRGLSHEETALALLSVAQPELPLSESARLSLGRRDLRILSLRRATFGTDLRCIVNCPGCAEAVEFILDINSLEATGSKDESSQSHELRVGEWRVEFRLPATIDLLELLAGGPDAANDLIGRCIVRADRSGLEVPVDALPAEVAEAVSFRMEGLDPLADVTVDIKCEACGHQWQSLFDIVTYFEREIEAWASSVLRDVHLLAGAYGWTEPDVLSLSPSRRRHYVELVS